MPSPLTPLVFSHSTSHLSIYFMPNQYSRYELELMNVSVQEALLFLPLNRSYLIKRMEISISIVTGASLLPTPHIVKGLISSLTGSD